MWDNTPLRANHITVFWVRSTGWLNFTTQARTFDSIPIVKGFFHVRTILFSLWATTAYLCRAICLCRVAVLEGLMKTAQELGLPTGQAVMRDGEVIVLPPNHTLDRHRQTDVGPYPTPMAPSVVTHQHYKTSHVDRAKGYRIAVQPLSIIMGFLSVIVAVFGVGVPMLSITVLAWFGTAYAITWLMGYLIHAFISPDGLTILHALLGYRIIRHEQKNRHMRYPK